MARTLQPGRTAAEREAAEAFLLQRSADEPEASAGFAHDGEALADARAELAGMAEAMRHLEAKAAALVARLKVSAADAEPVGAEGETAEGWLADCLASDLGALEERRGWCAASLADMAGTDWRAEVLRETR